MPLILPLGSYLKIYIKSTLTVVCFLSAMGRGVKSDSEASVSDVDMEDISMHYYQGDGVSTDEVSDDYSLMSIGSSDDSNVKRKKHRPRSLNIPRSHSATSSDDETSDSAVSTDTENRLAPLAIMSEARVAQAASAFAEEMEDFKGGESSMDDLKVADKSDSNTHSDNELKVNVSPSPPRSPSWRAGLESPPFSPKRKGSYPAKKRPSSPVSPKDCRLQFTYDISPHGQEGDIQYPNTVHVPGASANTASYSHEHISHSSPEDFDEPYGAMNEPFLVKIPESKPIHNLHDVDTGKVQIPDTSTVAIDLATYAATIASNTASLTQMTVSPTNNNILPIHDREHHSSDSESIESTSPLSPGYYENATEDLEEVELADPSSKPIDYQGTKRQKARPPSTDWSPVIDLSPILDVSPSIEEAEQEDMLEKQEEERRRRESQEEEDEDEDGDDFEHFFKPVDDSDEKVSFYGLKRYERVENICQLLEKNNTGVNGANGVGSEQILCSTVNTTTCGPINTLSGPFTCTTLSQSTIVTQSVSSSETSLPNNKQSGSLKSDIEMCDMNSTTTTYLQTFDDIANDLSLMSSIPAMPERPPKPVPRPRRKLPEPTADMIASSSKNTKVSSKSSPKMPQYNQTSGAVSDQSNHVSSSSSAYVKVSFPVRNKEKVCYNINNDTNNNTHGNNATSNSKQHPKDKTSVQKQDSDERRLKAKDLRAKPNPLIIKHIESEEKSLSPQYKVLDSPPSPESRSALRRDYSDSTSVSPSSSPDREVYPFPSPVTPPDSDSSPPKPHSPSSPGTDFDDEAAFNKHGPNKKLPILNKSFEVKSHAEMKIRDKIRKFEQVKIIL